MPSVKLPIATIPKAPAPVAVADKEYKHSIVDTHEQPLNSLITHVEGASRIVDYYSQVLSSTETPQPYSTNLAPHLQQYRLIKDFEIKQQSFDYSFSDDANEAQATGNAYIYPPLIPNEGDCFIADIGSGKVGLFNVVSTSKRSIFKQACYEIDFSLLFIIDNKGFVDVLNQKVVETYNFVKDFILYGQNPLLVESEFNLLTDSKLILHEAVEDYINEFLSRELLTFVVPGHTQPTYDPFVVQAFGQVIDYDIHPRGRKVKILNVNELKEFYYDSIWNALINPSLNQHRNLWGKTRLASVKEFSGSPTLNSIRFSGFNFVVKPNQDLVNVDSYYKLNKGSQTGYFGWYRSNINPITASGSILSYDPESKACWCKVQNYYHSHHHSMHPWDPKNHLAHIAQYQHTCHDPDCPCVCHNTDTSDPGDDRSGDYVLGDSFWNDSIPSLDTFEQLVKRHLSRDKIDPAMINALLINRGSWTPKERFYKMLVLIIMLIAAIRSI